MFANVNGIRLAYSDSGAGRPVVLLVHGFPLNRSMWDPQLGSLKAAGARVVAPDLRGFGASEAGPPGPLTMDQHADDLVALLDALGIQDKVVYVGLSMGGYVGFALWRRHPERIATFVIADSRAAADTPEARQNRQQLASKAEELNSPQPAIEAMLPRLLSPHLRPGSLPEHLLRGMIGGSSPRAVADGARGLGERADSFPTLPTINVPSLVIVGEHDVLTPPEDSHRIAEGVPNARLVSIDQAGHMSNLENPDAFNAALLDFLKQTADDWKG
jgi:pimeloyl-ACP methyl ester carboxylesterase